MFINPKMVAPSGALPGRESPVLAGNPQHVVLGSPVLEPVKPGLEEIFLAGGCYWGIEELMWDLPGVESTSVGFMGGYTPNPTYREVCTGHTGHAETVRVLFKPEALPSILKTFWEHHDPTTLYYQGNDIGTQYRSAIFPTTPHQADLAERSKEAFDEVLEAAGRGPIVTEIVPAEQTTGYYPAEDEHQQYLAKNPFGYRCHAATGLKVPMPEE